MPIIPLGDTLTNAGAAAGARALGSALALLIPTCRFAVPGGQAHITRCWRSAANGPRSTCRRETACHGCCLRRFGGLPARHGYCLLFSREVSSTRAQAPMPNRPCPPLESRREPACAENAARYRAQTLRTGRVSLQTESSAPRPPHARPYSDFDRACPGPLRCAEVERPESKASTMVARHPD